MKVRSTSACLPDQWHAFVQVPIVGSVAMLYYKHVRRLSTQLRDLDGEMQAFAQARLANVRTVRAFANETLEAERFQQVPTLRHAQGVEFQCLIFDVSMAVYVQITHIMFTDLHHLHKFPRGRSTGS